MEILKRAKSGGEVASFTENPETVREECELRMKRAGYFKRNSKIIIKPPSKKYEENYVRIFGHD